MKNDMHAIKPLKDYLLDKYILRHSIELIIQFHLSTLAKHFFLEFLE